MGSGKSTVGPLVAARLGWSFLDVDDVIEAEAGAAIAELFARHGEAAFLTGEPLGNRFAGSGPVETLSNSQEKSKGCEAEDRCGKTSENVDERPEDHGKSKPQPRSHRVKKDAAEKPGDRI